MTDAGLGPAIQRSLREPTTSRQDVVDWLTGIEASGDFSVAERDLGGLDRWYVDHDSGDIAHESGRFFAVRGADVTITAEGEAHHWQQPVIIQTDVGVLGLVAALADGVLRFLVQAKMEPGNRRLVQVSPTVQATASNFQRVHQGDATPYLELFQEPERQPAVVGTLVSQLQSEQANRYLMKRNLNAVVLADAARIAPLDGRFRWVTLADLLELAEGDDLLHMDTRSILGSLPFADATRGAADSGSITAWLAGIASGIRTDVRLMPLRDVTGWGSAGGRIARDVDSPFEVVGVRVTASNREVGAWDQPLIRNAPGAVATLVTRLDDDGPQVLLSGVTGLGVRDRVELGPSLVDWALGEPSVPLGRDDEVRAAAAAADVVFEASLPEEGGRFLHSSVLHRIVVVAPGDLPDPGPTRRWATLDQVQRLGSGTSLLSMELRSLLACLPVSLRTAGT